MICLFLLLDIEEFALVTFQDEGNIATVPSKKVTWTSTVPPKEGDIVNVRWNNKKQYAAIMTGDIEVCICVY